MTSLNPNGPSKGVLILGGLGFIGNRLARHFAEQQMTAHTLSRSPARESVISPGVCFHQGSLGNPELLNELLPGVSTVIHLASDTTPGSSAAHPTHEARGNLAPLLQLLETLQAHPNVRLIYVSSGGTLYGNGKTSPVSEEYPLQTLSYYSAGKASAEAFIHAFCHQNEREAVILRPSNVYGPGQPIRAGFGIIPTLLHAAESGGSVDIWGDGETTRDYLYIDDLLELCTRLLRQPLQSGVRTYNAGSGHGCSLNELLRLVEQVSGRRIHQVHRPARRVDVKYIVLDNSKIMRDLGWSSKTILSDGLTSTWKWFSENRH